MITRRKGYRRTEPPSPQVEVADVETVCPLSPSQRFPADDMDPTGVEIDNLFGIEDFKWSLDKDEFSQIYDMELANLGVYNTKDPDSGREASVASSPEATSSESKVKNDQNHSSHGINKNAIAARLNRLKKKEYVTSLEKKVDAASTENHLLRQENSKLAKRVEELEDETRYLRAVLANESMLAQLLSRLSGVSGMKLSSSLFQGSDASDHNYALPRKRVKTEENAASGGVCLHVDQNHVSVEFCTKCAASAGTALLT